MPCNRRPSPRIEGLESRELLSLAAPRVVEVAHAQAATPLRGTVAGTFAGPTPGRPGPATDAGLTVSLAGEGRVRDLGRVTVRGELTGTGFILRGQPRGTIVLENARGSVTLALDGPTQPGGRPAGSGRYAARIVSGTGDFANVRGLGAARVTVTPKANAANGSFRMGLALQPPRR